MQPAGWFWVLFLLAVLVDGYHAWLPSEGRWPRLGGSLLVWALLAMLGWHVFGSPVK